MIATRNRLLGLLLLITFGVIPLAGATECLDYADYLGFDGLAPDVLSVWDDVVVGDLVYQTFDLGDDAGLRVLDISDPDSPAIVSTLVLGVSAWRMSISGDLAAVHDVMYGYRFVDISDPAAPVEVGSLEAEFTDGVAMYGDYAFALISSDMAVIDLSDPAVPTIVATVPIGYNGRRIGIVGDRAILTYSSTGIRSFDISDPTNPTDSRYFWWSDYTQELTVDGDQVLAGTQDGEVYWVDFSTPAGSLVGSFAGTGERVRDMAFYGDLVVISYADGQVLVVDDFDTASPTVVGALYRSGARCVTITHGNAYISGYGGWAIAPFDDPRSVPFLATLPIADTVNSITPLGGDLAIVTRLYNGFQIIDLSDPLDIGLRGDFDVSGYSYCVDVEGDLAFLAGYNTRFRVLDISDLDDPVEVGDHWVSSTHLIVENRMAYVLDVSNALRVLDVSDPTTPTQVGQYGFGSWTPDAVLRDDFLFAATEEGVIVLDVQDPTDPTLETVFATDAGARSVAVAGDLLFVGAGELLVLDVTEPEHPLLLGSAPMEWDIYEITVADGILYGTSSLRGMQIFDITNPAEPELIGIRNAVNGIGEVLPHGDVMVVCGGTSGIQTLPLQCSPLAVVDDGPPPPTVSLRNFPNPFNPSTVISFTARSSGPGELGIYDAAGRRVRTLIRGTIAAGHRRIRWDGRDDSGRSVPSGVYYSRLTLGAQVETGRLALVR